jgi:tripartite-type tricarboxylate transporter receptor subunit TctC
MVKTFRALAVMVALLTGPAASQAQPSVADFYKGKTIDLYIGYTQGGGYDLYARITAQHMQNHIPGNPTIVPRQMVGAGSLKAAAYVYEVAPKDGTAMAATAQELPLMQALGTLNIKFDATKVNWIGNPSVDNNVFVMWHTTGVKTVEDARKKEYVIAATGTDSTAAQYPQIMNTLFGTKFKIIAGYPGGRDMDLAMERGEVHGRGSNAWASYKSTQPDWLRDHKIDFLVQVGLTRDKDLPDVPLLMELATNDQDRAALKLLSAPTAVGRPLYTSPGVPADRVAALRKAFDDTVKDPAYLADLAKAGLALNPLSGEEIQKIAAEMVATPKPVVERLLYAIEGRDVVEKAAEKGSEKGGDKGGAK